MRKFQIVTLLALTTVLSSYRIFSPNFLIPKYHQFFVASNLFQEPIGYLNG